jgi:hypothetical protein
MQTARRRERERWQVSGESRVKRSQTEPIRASVAVWDRLLPRIEALREPRASEGGAPSHAGTSASTLPMSLPLTREVLSINLTALHQVIQWMLGIQGRTPNNMIKTRHSGSRIEKVKHITWRPHYCGIAPRILQSEK